MNEINVNGIMELLQNGVSPDAIADTFVKALNEAKTQFSAKQKEEELQKNKKADAKNVVRVVSDFCTKYGFMEDCQFSDEEMEQMAQVLVDSLAFYAKAITPVSEKRIDPIEDFLRKSGLL